MVITNKKFDGKVIGYEIFDDGYEIYLDRKMWISQRESKEETSKPYDNSKSYKENCLIQIDEITTIPEPVESGEWQKGYDQAILDMMEEGGI